MFEDLNRDEVFAYIHGKMKSEAAYKGVPDEDLQNILRAAMDADAEFMKSNKIDEGALYDEDEAYEYIYEKLGKGKDQEQKALVSLITDGYLEYWDQYLDQQGLIDWE